MMDCRLDSAVASTARAAARWRNWRMLLATTATPTSPRTSLLPLVTRLPNARGSAAARDAHRGDNAEAAGCSRLLGCRSPTKAIARKTDEGLRKLTEVNEA